MLWIGALVLIPGRTKSSEFAEMQGALQLSRAPEEGWARLVAMTPWTWPPGGPLAFWIPTRRGTDDCQASLDLRALPTRRHALRTASLLRLPVLCFVNSLGGTSAPKFLL